MSIEPVFRYYDLNQVLSGYPGEEMLGRHDVVHSGMELCRWRCSLAEWSAYLRALIEWNRDRAEAMSLSPLVSAAHVDEAKNLTRLLTTEPPETLFSSTGFIYGELACPWRSRRMKLHSIDVQWAPLARVILRFNLRTLVFWFKGPPMDVPVPGQLVHDVGDMVATLGARTGGR